MIKNLLDLTSNTISNNSDWLIGLVYGDAHYPQHNQAQIDNMHQLASDLKIDYLINIGDNVDFDSISHWLQDTPLLKLGMRLKDLFLLFNNSLKVWDDIPSIKRRIFCEGNHLKRLLKYINKHSELKGMFDIKSMCLLSNFQFYPYTYKVILGDIAFTHGTKAGVNTARSTVLKLGRNIVVGHSHSIGIATDTGRDSVLHGYNIGCSCKSKLDYETYEANTHLNGFAVFYLNVKTRRTYLKLILVSLLGGFIFDGKIYGELI